MKNKIIKNIIKEIGGFIIVALIALGPPTLLARYIFPLTNIQALLIFSGLCILLLIMAIKDGFDGGKWYYFHKIESKYEIHDQIKTR